MWKSLLTYPTFGLIDSQSKRARKGKREKEREREKEERETELNHIFAANVRPHMLRAETKALAETSHAMRNGRGWMPRRKPYPYVKKCLQHQWHSNCQNWLWCSTPPRYFTEACESVYSSIIHLFSEFMVGVVRDKDPNDMISSVTLDIRDTENSSIFQPHLSSAQHFKWDSEWYQITGESLFEYVATTLPVQRYTAGLHDVPRKDQEDLQDLQETIRKHWRSVFGRSWWDDDISSKESRNKPWIIAIVVNYNGPSSHEGNKIDPIMDIAYSEAGHLAREYTKIKTEESWCTTYKFFHHSISHLAPA